MKSVWVLKLLPARQQSRQLSLSACAWTCLKLFMLLLSQWNLCKLSALFVTVNYWVKNLKRISLWYDIKTKRKVQKRMTYDKNLCLHQFKRLLPVKYKMKILTGKKKNPSDYSFIASIFSLSVYKMFIFRIVLTLMECTYRVLVFCFECLLSFFSLILLL